MLKSDEINYEKLRGDYLLIEKKDSLSEIEEALIETLGRQSFQRADLRDLSKEIKAARAIYDRANVYVANLEQRRALLETRGFKPELIDQTFAKVKQLQAELAILQSVPALSGKIRDLERTIADVDGEIIKFSRLHLAGQFVDEIYAGELKEGFGPQIRDSIVRFVTQNPTAVDTQIRRQIQRLHSLDSDLQSAVLGGGRTLDNALQIQEVISLQAQAKAAEQQRAETVYGATVVPPKAGQAPIRVESPIVLPPTPRVPTPEEQKAQEDTRRREEASLVAEQNKSLEEHLNMALVATEPIEGLSLKPDQLTHKARLDRDKLLARVGRFHPLKGVLRILDDYPRLQAENRMLREERVHRDFETGQKDTRTGR